MSSAEALDFLASLCINSQRASDGFTDILLFFCWVAVHILDFLFFVGLRIALHVFHWFRWFSHGGRTCSKFANNPGQNLVWVGHAFGKSHCCQLSQQCLVHSSRNLSFEVCV